MTMYVQMLSILLKIKIKTYKKTCVFLIISLETVKKKKKKNPKTKKSVKH